MASLGDLQFRCRLLRNDFPMVTLSFLWRLLSCPALWAWSLHDRPWWATFLSSLREMVSRLSLYHPQSLPQGAVINICWMTARRQGGKKEKKKEFLPLTLYSAYNYILLISKNKQTNWQMKNSNEHHKAWVWVLNDSQRKNPSKR